MLSVEEQARVDEQIALSKSLSLGIALSVLPVAGLGSAAAIWIGVRAQKKIRDSGERLVGRGAATWCIVAGILGILANALFWWLKFFVR